MPNDIKDFFNTVILSAEEYLLKCGYSRSGKSYAFYKISDNKKKGGVILFRRSIFNSPDFLEFGINHAFITSDDVIKYSGSNSRNVTVSFLKRYASSQGLNSARIIDESIVESEEAEDYFYKNIEPQLETIVMTIQT